MTDEIVVTNCSTEVATFSDDTAVLRQRPWLSSNKEFNIGIVQPDFFRGIFKVGSTVGECKARLANPEDVPTGGDGRGVGRI